MSYTTAVQKAAVAVGAAFLLVGILGFVPGVTSDYDAMTFAGHESGAHLLGIFEVSILHNIVHFALGAAMVLLGVLLSRSNVATRTPADRTPPAA